MNDHLQEPKTPETPPFQTSKQNPFLFNEDGLRAGWRLLLLVLWVRFITIPFALLLLRPLGHAFPSRELESFDFLLTVGLAAGILIMARIEDRSFLDFGLRDRMPLRHFLTGVVSGFLAITLMLSGLHEAHHFYFGPQHMHGAAALHAALTNSCAFLIVAVFEETAFRSYPLYTLADGMGFWPAAVLISLVFAWLHVQNSGESKIGIAAVFAFGMTLAFSLWRIGSLLWAIGFHFMWDYSETFIYGVPDSGFVSPQHLLSAKFVGPAWITGGTVGPEGSAFIFLVLALVALLIHLQYPTRTFRVMPTENRR